MTARTLKSYADEWKSLPWKQFQKVHFRLQHRIYKAKKRGDVGSVKRLQSLLIGSKCSKYLAVRQVTQLNTGKKTAGVDGISSLNPKERMLLAADLGSMKGWKHRKLRRVYIPKSGGKRRPLGIPTIRDRAMQCLVKFALEPVYEAYASDGSYGFRPGHSTWDVQSRIFQNLKSNSKGSSKSILEIDIKSCFDEIKHESIMSQVTLPNVAKSFLYSALTAGVLNERNITSKGTPQGGVISPLLCNIALHGVEDLNNEWVYRSKWHQKGLRYADDMIFILNEGECGETLLNKVKDFLQVRGLKAQEAKTRLVSSKDGFDFLGWHFKVKPKNNKFVSYPSSKNRKAMVANIKAVMRNTRYKLIDRLKMVKTIYRGWWNYHQYSDMSQINLWSINKWIYKYVRKNSSMSGKEVIEHSKAIFNEHTYKVNRYPAIRGTKSIYDGDLAYWSKRSSRLYTEPLSTALKNQAYRCNSCGLRFSTVDRIELHHIDGNDKKHKLNTVEALHRSCHQHQPIHREKLMQRKSRSIS